MTNLVVGRVARCAIAGVVTTLLGLALAGPARGSIDKTARAAEERARSALALMRQVRAFPFPPYPPEQVRFYLSDDELLEEFYEAYTADFRSPRGVAPLEFDHAVVLRVLVPKLARQVRRFWKQPMRKHRQIAPYLLEAFAGEKDPVLREILWGVLSEVLGDWRLLKEPQPVLEARVLDFLERDSSNEDRKRVLSTLFVPSGMSEEGVLRLVRWSEQLRSENAEPQLRVELIRGLVSQLEPSEEVRSRRGRVPPPPLVEHLNRVAEGDPCDRCRSAAVDWRRAEELGRMQVFVRILEEGVCDAPATASALALLLGKRFRLETAWPGFLRMLDCESPNVRYSALWGVAWLRGEDAVWYAPHREWRDRMAEAYDMGPERPDKLQPGDLELLERLVEEARRRGRSSGEGADSESVRGN